jgi:hypothetical protein
VANAFDQFDGGNPFDQFDAPKQADPKLGRPEGLSFAEKYIAPVLERLQAQPGMVGDALRAGDGNIRGSAAGRLAMGAASPGVGAVQLAAHLIGQGDAVDNGIRDTEAQYQQARAEAGSEGADVLRGVGQAGMSMLPLSGVAKGAGLLKQGLLQGAAAGALEPILEGDFAKGKAKAIATGAGTGAVLAPVMGGLARVISPNASLNPELALLRQEGVTPSIGQVLGGAANTIEEKAISMPFLGSMIQRSRGAANDQFRKAAFQRAADPVGASVTDTGRAGVGKLADDIGAAYEKVIPRMGVDALDPAFVDKLANLRGLVKALPEQEAKQFDSILEREVGQRMAPNGMLTGQNLKDAWNGLRDRAATFQKSSDAYQSQLGDALKQAFTELKDHVATSSKPADVAALKAADLAWANFKRVQRAAGYVGNEGGEFTPAQLQSAVKAMDRSKDRARFAEGDALMQDLSDAGKSVLSSKVPNSGTADRHALIMSVLHPLYAVGGAAASTLYTQPVQNALRALVASRPESAPMVANALRILMLPATAAAAPMSVRARERRNER